MKTLIERLSPPERRRWSDVLLLILLALILSTLVVQYAQGEDVAPTLGIGAAFAPIGGHGFSLRKMPETGFGFQMGTIFWKTSNDAYFNVGGELLYILKHTRLTAFYVPVGIGFSYLSQLQYRYDPSLPNQNEEYREKTTHISGGAGLGFAARPQSWEDIWFSLDLVMVAEDNDILPLPQFAIHYFFR